VQYYEFDHKSYSIFQNGDLYYQLFFFRNPTILRLGTWCESAPLINKVKSSGEEHNQGDAVNPVSLTLT